MKSRPILRERWVRCWRIAICLLVTGLVLYNPFVALGKSSDCLSYQRLACNRATVGSAEFQILSPSPDPNLQSPDVDADVPQIEPAVILQAQEPAMDQEEMIPAEPELLAGVWFRPPPTLQVF
jgi:hypothetical protein